MYRQTLDPGPLAQPAGPLPDHLSLQLTARHPEDCATRAGGPVPRVPSGQR